MNRRAAIAKATLETGDLAPGGALAPEQAAQFIDDIQGSTKFSSRIRVETRTAPTGSLSRIGNEQRLIRKSTENSDDGYRAGLNFPEIEYAAQGIRLPFEVTLDALHENIEGTELERKAESRMTTQFALDLEDLGFNGLGTGADPFLSIDEGWISQAEDEDLHVVDGSTINSGDITFDHLFAALEEIDEDVADAAEDELIWVGRRKQHLRYIEALADRATSAGDRALLEGSPAAQSPLGQEWLRAGKMPADTIMLCVPEALCRVITWEMLHFRVGPETDKSLAARKAVFHIWHIKVDHIVIDFEKVVIVNGLTTS